MDDRAARSMFLFGAPEPPGDIDETFPIDVVDLPPGSEPWEPAWWVMRRPVVEQVLEDSPEGVWATAQRLAASGCERSEVIDHLARGMFYGLAAELGGERAARMAGSVESNADLILSRVATHLANVPLPNEGDVFAAIRHVVAAEQGIDAEAAVPRVVTALGRASDDALAAGQVRSLLNLAVSEGFPLAPLTGGRIVDRSALATAVVLTHRLTAAEIEANEVRLVLSDVCLFAFEAEPTLASGIELDHVEAGRDSAWVGPPGWLDGYRPGQLVAIRCRSAGDARTFAVEPVDTADTPPGLLEAFRRVFDAEAGAESDVGAVPAAAVAATLVIDDPAAFSSPRTPISELAAAAGLEVRGTYLGCEPHHWRRLRRFERHERLHDLHDDADMVHRVLDILDRLEADDAPTEDVRAALRRLRAEDDLARAVVLELAPADPDPVAGPTCEELAFAASRVLGAARHSDEIAVACWIAAVIAERTGDVDGAEHHLRTGYVADQAFDPIVDRCAWYAADRGDAATANRLWRSLADPPANELATLAPFIGRAERSLGRNEPCWCGSGRKFKTCHQRQPDQPPLSARVPWLYGKAISFLMRHEGAGRAAVMANVLAMSGGESVEAVMAAASRPIVVDAALHEGG